MDDALSRAQAREELGQVDFFLEQLALAVERGEVHRASYDLLAPRYLARRAQLVAILTGVAAFPTERQAAPLPGVGALGSPLAAGRRGADAAPSHASALDMLRPQTSPLPSHPRPQRRESAHVGWTTVLLFLGAFLVIAAAAIFALTVWSSVGPLIKLAFMGVTTAAFYAAGYYARTKLRLLAGSTALTVVASAMLIFDCWIVIDGYHLTGPLPWALALLVTSAVYWLTEVALKQRFYGVAGAAAQIGWWWLAADGLHLDPIVRIAVIAFIGVLWQLLAARAEGERSLRSLAEVLLWAAPVVELLAGLAALATVVANGDGSLTAVLAAAVTAASGGVVAMRTRLLPPVAQRWVAGALQVPLFVAIMSGSGPTWPGVAGLAALAAAYTIAALSVGGAPLALPVVAAEALAVASVIDLLKVGERGSAGVVGVLGLSWVVAGFLITRAANNALPAWLSRAKETGLTLRIVGFVPLVLASFVALQVGNGPALAGGTIVASDVTLVAVLLTAWAASSMAWRRPLPAAATIAWSFYSLAALSAWAFPKLHSATYAIGLLALALVWLFSRDAVERFYGIRAEILGWVMRATMLLAWLGGLAAEEFFFHHLTSWPDLALTGLACVAFLADAFLAEEPVSAAIAAGAFVFAAELLGMLLFHGLGPATLVATGAAVAGAVAAWATRPALGDRARTFAVAAATTALLACQAGVPEWWLAGALSLTAVAWALAAVTSWEPLALAAGLSAIWALATTLAAANALGWVTLVSFAAAAVVLGLPSIYPPSSRGAKHEALGASLALAGGLGLAWLALLGYAQGFFSAGGWPSLGPHGFAVALLALGAYCVVQARLWRVEPLVYAGFLVVLLSPFAEFHARHLTTAEYFSTPAALYLIAMGYLYVAWDRRARTYPAMMDLGAVVIGLGIPVVLALSNTIGKPMIVHTSWAIGLSLVAIMAGVAVRSRYLLFGGAAALALVAGWRTLSYLAELWWLVLGIIGVAMLVVALTWERQRQFIGETRARLQDSFENWR